MKNLTSITIAFLCSIFLISCLSSSNEHSGSDTLNVERTGLNQFINQNKVGFFFKINDTLFCKTKKGVKFYDAQKDTWIVTKNNTLFAYKEKIEPVDQTRISFPKGYPLAIYTNHDKKHNNWSLFSKAGEGAIYDVQELIDTIQKCVYSFPYESVQDFYIDSSYIWLGSDFGISRIDKKTYARKEYLTLPAFQNIRHLTDREDEIIYLDYYYGLFNYHKTSHSITPYLPINKLSYEEDLKFHNATLIEDVIYILSTSMDRCANYLGNKTVLLVYDLKKNILSRYESEITYFDTFLKYQKYLLCYGERQEYYEGGATDYYGGAVAFDLENKKLIELTNIPLVNIKLEDNTIKATSILLDEYWLSYQNLTINPDFNSDSKVSVVDQDTLFSSYLPDKKEGDTILFNEKKLINQPKKFEEYSKRFAELQRERKFFSDSAFLKNSTSYSEITIDRKPVTFYKY